MIGRLDSRLLLAFSIFHPRYATRGGTHYTTRGCVVITSKGRPTRFKASMSFLNIPASLRNTWRHPLHNMWLCSYHVPWSADSIQSLDELSQYSGIVTQHVAAPITQLVVV